MSDVARIECPGIWNDVQSTLPWVSLFNKHMRRVAFPHFRGKNIVFATDSSGLRAESPYETLSILIADFDSTSQWEKMRQTLRKIVLKDGRRMSFKKLDEPIRKRATIPFLRAANRIPGLCLSIAIHKEVQVLGLPPTIQEHLAQAGILKSRWTALSFERMSRTAHLLAILVAGICSASQNVTWISDEDEMFESQKKSEDTAKILSTFSSMYVKHKPNLLQIGTTKLDEGDRFEEDLTAIADLAAGAFCEALIKLHRETGGRVTGSIVPTLTDKLSLKSDLILSWLEDSSHPLKRALLIVDRRVDGKIGVGRIWSENLKTQPGAIG